MLRFVSYFILFLFLRNLLLFYIILSQWLNTAAPFMVRLASTPQQTRILYLWTFNKKYFSIFYLSLPVKIVIKFGVLVVVVVIHYFYIHSSPPLHEKKKKKPHHHQHRIFSASILRQHFWLMDAGTTHIKKKCKDFQCVRVNRWSDDHYNAVRWMVFHLNWTFYDQSERDKCDVFKHFWE